MDSIYEKISKIFKKIKKIHMVKQYLTILM